MSFDADYLVDRRRLKRSLTWWRVLAILALVLAVAAAVGRFGEVAGKAHVARMAVNGLIVDDDRRDQALSEIADSANVKTLIVRVNSPGGTVVGGEALYRNLRTVAEKKPVVVVMGEVAASAAYMTALGGDHILAREREPSPNPSASFCNPPTSRGCWTSSESSRNRSRALPSRPNPTHWNPLRPRRARRPRPWSATFTRCSSASSPTAGN